MLLLGLIGFSGASFAQFSASQIGPLPSQIGRGQQTTMPITLDCPGCATALPVTVDVTLPKLEYVGVASLTNGTAATCVQQSTGPLVMRCSFTSGTADTSVLTLNVRGNTVAVPSGADIGSTTFTAVGVAPTAGTAQNTTSITLGGDLLSSIDSPAASTVSTGNTVTFTVSGKVNTPIGGLVTVADAIPIGTVINMRLTIPSGFTFNSSAPGGGSAWTCSAPVATYRDCSYTVAGSEITTLPPYTIAGTVTAGNGSAITATSSISVGGASPPYADINTSNNTDAVTLTVGNLPNLTTAIKYQQGSTVANSNAPVATFTNAANGSVIVATATNAGVGDASASEVELRFVVPDGFTSTGTPTINGFTCAKDVVETQLDGTNGDVIVCTGLALNAGASASVTWPVDIANTPPTPNNGLLRSRVTMRSGTETSTGDNTASWNYAINNPYADLSVTQSFTGISASNGVAAGAVYTANLTVKNNGPVPAVVSSGGTDKLYATLLVNDLIASATADAASTTAGWTCSLGGSVGTGSGTRLVTCERPDITLEVAGTTPLAITLTVTNGALPATPVTLTHTSCVGSTALSNATKLLADGPTPGDPDASATVGVVVTGVTDIADCSSTGTNSTAQTSSSQAAKVRLNKEVSKDGGVNWFDAANTGDALVLNATTPAGSVENDLWFRLTVDGVSGSPTINTLVVEDNLNFSGLLLNQSASGTFPVWSTLLEGTAISGSPVAVVPTYTGSTGTNSCGFTGSGTAKKLTCTFTDFADGSKGVILVKLARPFEAKTAAENRATVRSPDSFLAPQPTTPGPTDSILQDSTFQTVQPVFDLRAVASVATTGTLRYGQNITLSLSDDNLGPNPVDGATMSLPVDTTIFDILAVKCNGTSVPGPYTSPVTCAKTNMTRNITVPLEVVVRPRTPTPLPGLLPDSKVLTTTVAQTASNAQCEYSYRTGVLSTNCNDTNAQLNNTAAVTLGLNAPKLNLSITDAVVGSRVFPIQAAGSTVTYRLTAANNYNLSEGNVSKAEKVQIANRLKFTGTSAFDVPTGLSVALASSSVTLTGTVTRSTGLGTRTTVSVICKQSAANQDVICELANTGNLSDSYLDVGETVVVDLPMIITGNVSSTATLTTAARIASDESLRGFETDYNSSWTLADNADWGSGTDNQARVNVYPQPRADLAMTKTAGSGITFPVAINQPVPFDLKVENLAGGNTVTKIQVTDTLPPGWQFLTGAVNGTDYTPTVTNGTYAGLAVTGFVGGSACTVAAVSPATTPASQKMTCDLDGSFPSATDASNFLTVRVWARATEGVYKTPAVCGTNANNTAAVGPGSNGVDDLGNPLPAFNDAVAGNNSSAVATSVQCASIGGRTYLDLNGNNVQDGTTSSDDYGFAGVTFNLRGTDLYGNPVSRTVTSDNTTSVTRGDYLFSFLPPSDATGYTVTQTQPTGYINRNPLPGTGTVTAGTASIDVATSATVPVAPANSVIAGIQLNAGQSGVAFNFPEMPNGTLSSLAGKVYKDFGSGTAVNNNNGIPDALEGGIVNVPMTLTGLDSNGTPVSRTELTDASGAYLFAGLLPPDATGYTIAEGVIPAASGSYSDGKDTAGNATVAAGDPTTVNDRISGISMAAGENATGYNFGELEPPVVVPTTFPDLTVTKTTTTNRVAEGVSLIYTLRVKNIGSVATAGSYVVTDTLPATTGTPAKWTLETAAGTGWTCAITADKLSVSCTHSTVLQPGELNSSPIALSVKVGVGTAAFGPLRNVVQVTGGGEPTDKTPQPPELANPPVCGAAPEFNVCQLETPVDQATPDLVVTKAASRTVFTEGNLGSYVLRVKNAGVTATSGVYTVADRLPTNSGSPAKWTIEGASGNGWACTVSGDKLSVSCDASAVLQPGAESASTIAVSVRLASGAVPFGPLRNVVQVTGGGEPDDKKPQPGEVANPPLCSVAPTANVCYVDTPLQRAAGLSGSVWIDGGLKKVLDPSDKRLPQWIVEIYDLSDPAAQGKSFTELVRGGLTKQTLITDSQGYYEVCNLQPDSTYRVLFRDPANRIAFPGVVTNEQGRVTGAEYYSQIKEREGFQVLEVKLPASNGGPGCGGQGIAAPEQSLPLDPNGVVYDSTTRAPVPGAKVTLLPEGICTGYDPLLHVINYETYGKDAQGNPFMTTGDNGFYKFLLSGDPTAPQSCQFRLIVEEPAGYKPAPSTSIEPKPPLVTPTGPGIFNVQPQKPAPTGNEDTSYHFLLNLGLTHQEVFNNHIPLDPFLPGNIVLTKQGDRRLAEVGDTVLYTITVRLLEGDPVVQATVRDRLPAGFTLVRGTVRVNNVASPDPLGGLGPVLGFNLGPLQPNVEARLTYRVRVGVGAMQGDGINRARAHACPVLAGCIDPTSLQPLVGAVNSNEAQHKVEVTGGVFTDNACVLGKVFVDCNNNHLQDAEELGIPGVRLYFEDGRFMVSDSEGKYSHCGLTPRSHVLAPDPSTLPRGARLTTSSNRNLGDANSLFIDLKNGELHRADFIEGSCTNPVLEQVKARRTQGEVRSVETEKDAGPALRFLSKPLGTPKQGTDSANQPLVQPRQGGRDAR